MGQWGYWACGCVPPQHAQAVPGRRVLEPSCFEFVLVLSRPFVPPLHRRSRHTLLGLSDVVYFEAEALQERLRAPFRMPTTAQQHQIANYRERVDTIVRAVNALWR